MPKTLLVLLFSLLMSHAVMAVNISDHPKLQTIADELVSNQLYTKNELNEIFAGASVKQSILDAMMNPAEYKFTWGKYRKLFLQPDRIDKGVEFWKNYESELLRAEKEYGVPASIIVSIIGVESKFGQYKGKHRVLDSLVTLVVGYPRRSKFFADELRHFLILTKQNNLDVDSVLGSYAGAVGYPQFISSSYRNYAVDFSGDGKTDLINQPIDAIGSIANYFVENGWLTGEPVTSKPTANVPTSIAEKANRKRKVRYTATELSKLGAQLDNAIPANEKLNVLSLNINEIVPNQDNKETYLVRAGDTACQIAERFSVPCRSLFELNKLDAKGSIYRGQKLKLPRNKTTLSKSKDPSSKSVKTSVADTGRWTVNNNIDTPEEDSSQEQLRYFYTHENFYVITRYNHSVLYAMAVHDLSEAIAAKKSQFSQ